MLRKGIAAAFLSRFPQVENTKSSNSKDIILAPI